ncbi:MAG: hypothetical protein V2A76_01010 [Planctomycetota bacterium]
MHRTARLGIGLLLLGLCGCQSTPDQDKFFRNDIDRRSGWHHLGMYAKDVGLDALDIFTIDVAAGKAGAFPLPVPFNVPLPVAFNAHFTKYAELGLGSWTGYKFGWLGRGLGVWREERTEGGFAARPVQNYSVHAARVPYWGTEPLKEKYLDAHGYNINLDNDRHWMDIGLSLHVIAVGFDLNFSPFEALDLAFGFVGNFPNPVWISTSDMPWDIGVDVADDDTRLSIYDDKIGRYRTNAYSIWPTIWPTTFGHHEGIEGAEWDHQPVRNPGTVSVGGAYGGTHGTQH